MIFLDALYHVSPVAQVRIRIHCDRLRFPRLTDLLFSMEEDGGVPLARPCATRFRISSQSASHDDRNGTRL